MYSDYQTIDNTPQFPFDYYGHMCIEASTLQAYEFLSNVRVLHLLPERMSPNRLCLARSAATSVLCVVNSRSGWSCVYIRSRRSITCRDTIVQKTQTACTFELRLRHIKYTFKYALISNGLQLTLKEMLSFPLMIKAVINFI